MKKLTAILLTALLALSVAACSNNDNKEASSAESVTAESVSVSDNVSQDEESVEIISRPVAEQELDPDPDIQKNIEEKIDMEKLGPLTRYAVQMMENKNLKIDFGIEEVKDETQESSEASSSVDLSELTSSMSIGIIKNADKNYRIKLDMGVFSFDILKNETGVYSLNTRNKTYQVMQTAEQVKKSEEEASKAGNTETSNALENFSSMTGGMLDGFDADSMISNTDEKEVTFNGSGSEEYKEQTYQFESYTVKSKASASSESSGKTDDKTTDVKVYFDNDGIIKIIHVETDTAKMDFNINEISVKIDENDLVLPTDFTEKETSDIDLGGLDLSIPDA